MFWKAQQRKETEKIVIQVSMLNIINNVIGEFGVIFFFAMAILCILCNMLVNTIEKNIKLSEYAEECQGQLIKERTANKLLKKQLEESKAKQSQTTQDAVSV